ncbi:MAG: 1-deoxy-D-xylulose-5-phosphate synthase [Clostridiales bacterium]|nr:1-deoxy-D-xylulose-5-phosphate synthase [Clostridiales bacterium]
MYLEKITSPDDIRGMSNEQLELLSKEIRTRIISTISKNGGHLASNLGTVELTLALHSVFHCPQDKIVWDVGHQAYTHKLITGRNGNFDTIRLEGGISGFPKQRESEYDAYLGGHSGVSISAALGMAEAMRLKGEEGFSIAVIGDGSFSSGVAYEGMNNAGRSGEKIIIVLNDNDMSISRNVGNVANYLARMRTSKPYFDLKDSAKSFLDNVPLVGQPIKNTLARSKKTLRQMMYHSNMFEDFGLKYLGPVDGHDIESLRDVFQRAKEYEKPCLVHIHTVKGMGYRPARENPSKFHGVGPFDRESGRLLTPPVPSFSSVFGNTMCEMARDHPNLAVITAAMGEGTGLERFSQLYAGSDRYYDVGIAEEHAVSFACGMSTQGIVPVFAVYSTFLQRTFDQLIHDAALEPKHIVLAVDRAGVVGADGETHQGIFDVSMLRTVPGVVIYSPATFAQLQSALRKAVDDHTGIVAVRYPKGGEPEQTAKILGCDCSDFFCAESAGSETLLVSYGRLSEELLQAREKLSEQGIPVSVLVLNRICPLPDGVLERMEDHRRVLFYEEGIQSGSVAELCAARLMERGYSGRYRSFAIDNRFIPQCSIQSAYQMFGADRDSIIKTVLGE